MLAFLAKIIVTALALWMSDTMLVGMTLDDPATLVMAAVLLAFANTVVRPALRVLAFPITVLTLGVFILVVNGAVVYAVAFLLPGFHVAGLGTAVVASLVVSALSWAADESGRKGRKRR